MDKCEKIEESSTIKALDYRNKLILAPMVENILN